jgi:protocatechuate 3,4-dioxygenase beta subunit
MIATAASVAGMAAAVAAEPKTYALDLVVNLGDARTVQVGAAIPDGSTSTLPVDGPLKIELTAIQHPPGPATWHETRATLVDTSGGGRKVLRVVSRNSNRGQPLAGALSICGTRTIFVGEAGATPGRCADLLPLSPVDPTMPGCGDCSGAYEGLPSSLSNRARIAPASEPGEPLRVTGRVLGPDGEPRGGIIVYAYQTDRTGIYPPPSPPRAESNHHGTLRGWTRTAADGRYAFDTIRPGSYPDTTNPQHVHVHVIEPGCYTYFVDEMLFTDDPMFRQLPERDRAALTPGMGGGAVVTPTMRDGVAEVVRDIHLGRNIRGYPACGAK